MLNTKSLTLQPLALTIAAKTLLKALGDNLSRSTAATISGESRILLETFSSIKSGVALYLESKLPSKSEELGLVFSDDVSLLALKNAEKYLP